MYPEIRQTPFFAETDIQLWQVPSFANFYLPNSFLLLTHSLRPTHSLALSHFLTRLVFGLEDYFNTTVLKSSLSHLGFLSNRSASVAPDRLGRKKNTNFCFKGKKVSFAQTPNSKLCFVCSFGQALFKQCKHGLDNPVVALPFFQ